MDRFAKIDIGAGKNFDASKFTPEVQKAIGEGVGEAWLEFEGLVKLFDEGKITSGQVFGMREFLKNNDGSLSIYIRKDNPGADKESNWLPAPNNTAYLVMRLYWPKTEEPFLLPPGEGAWKPPGVVKGK